MFCFARVHRRSETLACLLCPEYTPQSTHLERTWCFARTAKHHKHAPMCIITGYRAGLCARVRVRMSVRSALRIRRRASARARGWDPSRG